MKTPNSSFQLYMMSFFISLLMACGHPTMQQFNVEFQSSDGTKEGYTLSEGSVLLVHDGDMHFIAKIISGNKEEMEMQVTRYSFAQDSIKGEHTIKKEGTSTNRISIRKNTMLDQAGTVQVNLQSTVKVDEGKDPKGKCKGKCCEAKCFSIYCCIDPDECKDVPCDCKPPSGCPGTYFAIQAGHFFELQLSGKDMMVFKN